MNIKDCIGETSEYDKKEKLEAKRPKSWCKSISAFANGEGGTLFFGVNEEEKIVGLENAKKDAETISEIIKTRLSPIPEFNLTIMEEEGHQIIVIDVYPGNQTPYYYEGDGSLMAYQRIGNQSVPVTTTKLRELVLKGSHMTFDALISNFKFEEMCFTKLKSTYKYRTGNSFEYSDFESFGIINERGQLTNAGVLLADDSPIRHSRVFCTRWNGLDKGSGILDAMDDKEFSGDLITLLQSAKEFVIHNSKKFWMKTKEGRLEMPDYPERAVLEGIVNALIHRSYLEIGSEIHLDMFDDRLEIYSPGGMEDGSFVQNRDLRMVPSKRRNPILADIFNRLRFMDRRGSGFKKILMDYEKQPFYTQDKKPVFYSDSQSFFLILKNMNYDSNSFKIQETPSFYLKEQFLSTLK